MSLYLDITSFSSRTLKVDDRKSRQRADFRAVIVFVSHPSIGAPSCPYVVSATTDTSPSVLFKVSVREKSTTGQESLWRFPNCFSLECNHISISYAPIAETSAGCLQRESKVPPFSRPQSLVSERSEPGFQKQA
jgi:hypothetical protein